MPQMPEIKLSQIPKVPETVKEHYVNNLTRNKIKDDYNYFTYDQKDQLLKDLNSALNRSYYNNKDEYPTIDLVNNEAKKIIDNTRSLTNSLQNEIESFVTKIDNQIKEINKPTNDPTKKNQQIKELQNTLNEEIFVTVIKNPDKTAEKFNKLRKEFIDNLQPHLPIESKSKLTNDFNEIVKKMCKEITIGLQHGKSDDLATVINKEVAWVYDIKKFRFDTRARSPVINQKEVVLGSPKKQFDSQIEGAKLNKNTTILNYQTLRVKNTPTSKQSTMQPLPALQAAMPPLPTLQPFLRPPVDIPVSPSQNMINYSKTIAQNLTPPQTLKPGISPIKRQYSNTPSISRISSQSNSKRDM